MTLPTRKILIIEDALENRALICNFLKEIKGYEISLKEAESGAKGLELCRKEKFDCVLVDTALPDMDGTEVLAALENEHGKNTIPVVIICIAESVENILKIFEHGAHDFLVKGKFSGSGLSRAIENAIEKADLRREKDQSDAQMRQLASIVEYSDDAIISQNLDGVILSWNKGAEKIYEYSAQEMVGQNIRKIFPPDQLAEEEMIVGKILNDESFIHYETIRIKKDGSQISVSLTVSPIKNKSGDIIAISKIARDISGSRQAEKKIQESNRDFQALIQATTQAVWTTSKYQGDVANAQWWMNLTGQTFEDLDEWKWLKALHPDDRVPAKNAWSDAFKNKTLFDVEYRVKNLQGIYQHFAVRGVPVFNDDGSFRKWIGTFTDITKRKLIEENLKHNEERYRLLFNDNPFPLVIYDFDTLKITEVNDAACELYGYAREEFLELTLNDFGSKSDINAIVEKVTANQESLVSYGAWEHKKKDGTKFFVETTSHKFSFNDENLRIVLIKDISDRKKAEDSLKFEKERFEKIASVAPGLICSLRMSPEGVVTMPYASPAIEEIYGLTAAEVRDNGNLIFERINPKDIGRINESISRSMLTMTIWHDSFRFEHAKKGEVWIEGFSAPVMETDGSVTWHGIITDITDRKKYDQEIIQLNESLEHKVVERTSELNATNKELEAFSYSVSHDLRAPLRAIDGFSLALIEDFNDKLDTSGQDYLKRIRQASQQMADLIDDMLLLSRVTRREIKRTDLNLSKLFAEIAENIKEINPRKNVFFEVEENVYAYGDEALIRIALENLIGNAYKFTSKKDFAKIVFGQVKTENGLEYFIKDNGAGFNMNYADKLFGAFQRLHRSDEFEGTGIGLATVQRVINKHGGKIRAEGKVGEGASFYFTL